MHLSCKKQHEKFKGSSSGWAEIQKEKEWKILRILQIDIATKQNKNLKASITDY